MKLIKTILKSIAVAFSLYSKIPMPGFDWESEDMKYHFAFFPFVGLVIGLLEYLWFIFSLRTGIGETAFGMFSFLIVIFITGGLHLDGFMDVSDALKSYGDRNKKLEILKDPHIGAFSVICLLGLFCVYVASVSEIYRMKSVKGFLVFALCFAISRCVSGILVLLIENARETGMSKSEKDSSNAKVVVPVLFAELIICVISSFVISWKLSAALAIIQSISFLLFYRMIRKQFGGITGDLAGYYVCVNETLSGLVIFLMILAGIN